MLLQAFRLRHLTASPTRSFCLTWQFVHMLQEYFRGFLELLKFQHEAPHAASNPRILVWVPPTQTSFNLGRQWLVRVNKGYSNRLDKMVEEHYLPNLF